MNDSCNFAVLKDEKKYSMITVDKEEVCGKALGPLSKSELQSLTWSQNIFQYWVWFIKKIYILDFIFLYYIVKGHFRNHVSLGPTIVGWTAPGIFYLFQEKILHWPPMYWFLNWNGWFTYPKTKVTVSYKLWFYKIACVDRESNPEQQLGRLLC